MRVEWLQADGFRNYRGLRTEFSPGLNLIVGPNGQGKTNLLEAVQVLCGSGSHRTGSSLPLITLGGDQAILRAQVRVQGLTSTVSAEIKRPRGVRLKLNGASLEGLTQAAGMPAAVLFSPEDLGLVKGGPDERRRFIDGLAASLRPLAAARRQEFERVLRQRNGLLKAAVHSSRADAQLDVWTDQLAQAGAAVVEDRLRALDEATGAVTGRYEGLTGAGAQVRLEYAPSWAPGPGWSPQEASELLAKSLIESRQKDIERAMTTTGPHRDDLEISLRGAGARQFASQGEQRTLALALRLAECDLVTAARGEQPILLLDDVFSELDSPRRTQVAEMVHASGQTLLTATSADDLGLRAAARLKVSQGRVTHDG